jgi:hypothetical protein
MISLAVGQRGGVNLSIGAGFYDAYNARSFNSGACDDYWNYAWTVFPSPP